MSENRSSRTQTPRGRHFASLSLDLDNVWAYMMTHGDPGWEAYPSYLETLSEVVVEQLGRRNVTLTVFVVGRDASFEVNRPALQRLAAQGHEIGNHSFSHEPWFHTFSREQTEREIVEAEDHIEAATGRRTRGFRGPGFSLTAGMLEVLAARGYDYDATTYPTFLGPLARAYYLRHAPDLEGEELAKRAALFGSWRDGLRPLHPYRWAVSGRDLVEVPVTTMPVLRTPIHMSYLIHLAGLSRPLARLYLEIALTLARLRRVNPSFLLHPLDFLGGDRVTELGFFPGMALPTARKLELVDWALRRLGERFETVTVGEHARRALLGDLPLRPPPAEPDAQARADEASSGS
jgi:peptidoglycan/xylan/chitin deacetylase (PgdA/CDA1 family)